MYARVMTVQLYSRRLMALCALVCAVSAILYGVLLLMAVERTAVRAAAQSAIQSTSAQLATLEQQYLSLTNAITPARAQELGFILPKQSDTVFADASSNALSFQDASR